jgi:sulfonate transport system substrate-binding protein
MFKNQMFQIKKILAVLLTVVLTAGLATGCQSTASTNTENAKNGTDAIRIALQPVVGYLPLYILKDSSQLQDAYAAAGYDIDVVFTEFESGPPENEAFASGLQDVGVMGNVPAVSGIAAGQKRSIIGIAYNGEKTEAVLVPTDSEIKSVADLKGKKIGLVVGSIAQNLLNILLEENGLSVNDVELINLSTGEQQEALATAQVDAVATWEPTITKIKSSGIGKVLADGTGVFLGENPIIARTEYVEENPEIVKIFLDEYEKAAIELNANREKYAQEYSDKFNLDADLIVEALDGANEPIAITDEDAKDLQGTVDFLYNSEIISKSLDINDYIITGIGEN